MAAWTRFVPGSEIRGVPASDTSAIFLPLEILLTNYWIFFLVEK